MQDALCAHWSSLSLTHTPKTQALRAARDEVRSALATAECALTHLDAPRQLEAIVLAGPEADLAAFVEALGRLDETASFLKAHSGLAAADAARESAAALRADGGALALRYFETLLRLHSGGRGRADQAAGKGGGGAQGGGEQSGAKRVSVGRRRAPPPAGGAIFFEGGSAFLTPRERCRVCC